jgi:GTPase SAR1 family protein
VKIFVIGAEGAGKTVFIAMLSRYLVEHHGDDLMLEPATFETSQYIADIQSALEQGDWPPSTRMGQSVVLKWKLIVDGTCDHTLLMYDAAGQDLRTLMLSEALEDLSEEERTALSNSESVGGDHATALRQKINESDVLVYLLDLEAFLGTSDSRVRKEHCWLLKAFLTHPLWRDKQRLVLMTKMDKYEALLARTGNDVRRCIQEHLPKHYAVRHCLNPQNGVTFAAVSSVATHTIIGADETPLRLPSRPFRAGDLSASVEFLRRITAASTSALSVPAKTTASPPGTESAGCLVLLLLLIAALGWMLWPRPISPSTRVSLPSVKRSVTLDGAKQVTSPRWKPNASIYDKWVLP